jgi:hypothetical protein
MRVVVQWRERFWSHAIHFGARGRMRGQWVGEGQVVGGSHVEREQHMSVGLRWARKAGTTM